MIDVTKLTDDELEKLLMAAHVEQRERDERKREPRLVLSDADLEALSS